MFSAVSVGSVDSDGAVGGCRCSPLGTSILHTPPWAAYLRRTPCVAGRRRRRGRRPPSDVRGIITRRQSGATTEVVFPRGAALLTTARQRCQQSLPGLARRTVQPHGTHWRDALIPFFEWCVRFLENTLLT